MLQALRPKAGADLALLHKLVEGRGWRASLPSAMPDRVLLSLARDFRTVECSLKGEIEQEPDLAGPMFLVLNLLMELPGAPTAQRRQVQLSEDALFRGVQFYQWAVEREIVARIVGLGSAKDSESLMEALRRIEEDSERGTP